MTDPNVDHAQRTFDLAQRWYDCMEPPDGVGDEQDDDVGSVEWDDDDELSFPPEGRGCIPSGSAPAPFCFRGER